MLLRFYMFIIIVKLINIACIYLFITLKLIDHDEMCVILYLSILSISRFNILHCNLNT